MKILGIDSTANVCCAAVCEDERLISEITVNTGNTHSEILLPAIEDILKLSHTDISKIDMFACCVGPGSFTGVRIGAATIKGLAFAKDIPCCEVSSLESLAKNLCGYNGIISPVINARRMQVYNAIFSCHDGILVRLTPDRAISVEELDAELASYGEKIYLSGDGYDICEKNFKLTHIEYVPDRSRIQSAYSACMCAYDSYRRGEYVSDKDLSPSYLRLSQAERERNERLNSGVKF